MGTVPTAICKHQPTTQWPLSTLLFAHSPQFLLLHRLATRHPPCSLLESPTSPRKPMLGRYSGTLGRMEATAVENSATTGPLASSGSAASKCEVKRASTN